MCTLHVRQTAEGWEAEITSKTQKPFIRWSSTSIEFGPSIHMHIHIHTQTHMCTHRDTRAHTYTQMHTRARAHTHTNTHTHTVADAVFGVSSRITIAFPLLASWLQSATQTKQRESIFSWYPDRVRKRSMGGWGDESARGYPAPVKGCFLNVRITELCPRGAVTSSGRVQRHHLSVHSRHHENSFLGLQVKRKQFAGSAKLCNFLPVSGWLVRAEASGRTHRLGGPAVWGGRSVRDGGLPFSPGSTPETLILQKTVQWGTLSDPAVTS